MKRAAVALAVWTCVSLMTSLEAQQQPRFLAKEEIAFFGIGLKAEPARQVVPKDIATIVSTFLQAPTLPDGLPPFAPSAEVRATLRGPSFAEAQELVVSPNTPFNIPPLTVPGIHTLENIRLISNGEVLLRGVPESVVIDVIDKLLVTQVTARALTAAEIREKGIVFDRSSFQAYNFSAAFAIEEQVVNLDFPVVLPQIQGAQDVSVGDVRVPQIQAPALPNLQTIIPDTLRLQTQIPNLSVIGFTLKVPELKGQNLFVPPIPGVIVIPGDIGFLNQFFSVMLMVGNVAPEGSNLVVSELEAEIVLPPGSDQVVASGDDPLRMARTASGETPRRKLVVQPGADGKLGTADDIGTLGPGESGNAEYLVEGMREGSHIVEMEMKGILNGLPVGPVEIRGRAAGAVLVRNPTFTLTFTHPEVVSAGEPYTLDVSVTNTGQSPANFVSLNLYPRNVSGATIVGSNTRDIESILPGDSATVNFDLISRITGKVTAATLDSNENVAGRFALKTAVGELGVPLSPDSLVLPKESKSLPADLRDAAIGLLGKAWAVATSPAAALPKDIKRFSKKVVIDRAVEIAEAGFRVSLREPLADSAAHLAMDFMGSKYSWLPELNPRPEDLTFAQENFAGFDALRRQSVRGDRFADAVAALLAPNLIANGPHTFHNELASRWSYRPVHVSALIGGSAGSAPPYRISLVDAQGRRVGGFGANGKVLKEIPYSDLLLFNQAGGGLAGEMAVLAVPDAGVYTVRLDRVGDVPDGTPYVLTLVVPTAAGGHQQLVFEGFAGQGVPVVPPSSDPHRLVVAIFDDGAPVTGAAIAAQVGAIADPPPTVLGALQQTDADQLRCEPDKPGIPVGRIIAVLFSEEVTAASVQDKLKADAITNYLIEGNQVVGVALQPGRRIAFLALRDPYGPFIPRQITISNVMDARGQPMPAASVPIEATIGDEGGVLSGRVIRADGTPVAFANVRLFYLLHCGEEPTWVGISSKSADEQGRYSWDYVTKLTADRIVAIDSESEEFRDIRFNVQRNGQRLNVDIVMLGRGTFQGRTLAEDGRPLSRTSIKITSLTDNSEYGATTDDDGRFAIGRIPVGNVLVEAVNATARAQFFLSENIPFAGAITARDITLLNVELREITIKNGVVQGFIYQADGVTPLGDVPVIAYYQNRSQPNVPCPAVGSPPVEPPECAVGVVRSANDGTFLFEKITAGALRLYAFDQGSLAQGGAHVVLPPDATRQLNILLAGGLGTVLGKVVDPAGNPVVGARVGGGFTLTTTNAQGEFTLTDVPVGSRDIVAVSDELGTSGSLTVDITRAGETVGATIVLRSVGSVAGRVTQSDGTTPAANIKVYLFRQILSPEGPKVQVFGVATTDASGGYRMDKIQMGSYEISAFTADFTDGNIGKVVLKFHQQSFKADLKFRGGGGIVHGAVFDDDGVTPLKARLGLSADQLVVAGGQVGVAFQHIQNYKIVDTDFTTGQYSFAGLWVGGFTLRAVGQFSPDPIAVDGTISAPNETVEVNLRLKPTSQIKGIVYQPDGVTPVGANVVINYKSEEFKVFCSENKFGEETCVTIPQGIQSVNAVTDDDGRFFFPIVNAGSFTLTVEDPVSGKVAQVKGNVKAGETADLSVRLLGIAELTVQVFASDATTAIANAKVEVEQLQYPKRKKTLIAGTDGTIVFGGGDAFSEGELVITATDQSSGFAARASAKIVKDGQNVLVKVFLYNASGTVYGTVFKADGITPVPNAEVVISNLSGPLAFAVTDSDGSYRTALIPLGPFFIETFEAASARRAFASGRVDLANQEVPVNLVQSGLGVVKGTLLQGGALSPLKGWEITLQQTSPSGRSLPTLKTTTAIDGTWSFPGTSRGTFTANASKPDVNGFTSAAGEIERDGAIVDVPLVVSIHRLLKGRIEGVVFNPDGSAAANSAVEICYPGVCGFETPPARVTTDGNGVYFLDDVPLGRFTVTAMAQLTRNVGKGFGDLEIDGDVVSVDVRLVGLTIVSGVVLNANGSPATSAVVRLDGSPATGCVGSESGVGTCVQGVLPTDGTFSFVDVPAKTFTVSAADAVTGLKGAVGGILNPGEHKTVTIVLEPTGSVSGKVFTAAGKPAQGIVAELILLPNAGQERRLYQETKNDGSFLFDSAPLGSFTLILQDVIGTGMAQRTGTVAGNGVLGNIVLDEAPPAIASSNPAASATGVPQNQAIRLTFTEAILPGTVNATTVRLESPTGLINYALAISDGDTVATLTPLAPLADETRYVVRVNNVKDRVGKEMAAPYTASFTTVDITAPAFVSINPAPDTNGVPIYTPVRIQFTEPIDPTKFAAPFALNGPQGTVAGRLDYLLGNTVVVFTPNLPLAENAIYTVTMSAAVDRAGNAQPQDLQFVFSTTDRSPPQILELVAANNGQVIENAITSVVANVGVSHDVAVVDWFINDVFMAATRAFPFTLQFVAKPEFGAPGSQIKVSAIAIDTSGNRGVAPIHTLITVLPDQPPAVNIATPVGPISARNGDRIVVDVTATDDVGVAQIAYKAATGQPQDAATRNVGPPVMARTEQFAFIVPGTAAPGSTIEIQATARDVKGNVVHAAPRTVTVIDAVNPVVTITGTTSGQKVNPGQTTSAIVSVEDIGGVVSLTFTVGGLVTTTETRVIDPAQNSVAAAFSIQVPSTATPGQTLTLDAAATDRAGNKATAARVILPIADSIPPTVKLVTETGSLEMVRGRPLTIFADAEDGIAISRVELTGQGAFTVSDAKPVSPPVGSARVAFTINVPETLDVGATLTLRATAVDISGNVSSPAILTLTVRSLVDVTLPPSAIVIAGETISVPVQLAEPAPAGGLRLDFTSADANTATVTPFVQFAAGETTRQIVISGVSGGSAAIRALIQGVQRATMTATVRGGIVRGVVRNSQLEPVAGVSLTINGAVTAETNSSGEYFVEGVSGPFVSVKALDPATRQRGHTTASMNHSDGHVVANVILIPAGLVRGDVKTAAGALVGAGVTVEIFAANDLHSPLEFTFTDDEGAFEFPLVTTGNYLIEATSTAGHRGRSSVIVGADGEEEVVSVVFLGEGTVVGTVLDGAGVFVPRAPLTLRTFSIFGAAPPISINAEADGTFRFERVLLGTFTIEARDLVTGQGGTTSGTISQNGQQVLANVGLSTFASLTGVVFRPDGVTVAVGATVRVHGHSAVTNDLGEYSFAFLPLGGFTVTVNDEGTRQMGRASGALNAQGETQTLNITLLPQGSVIVTVNDATGQRVPGASLSLSTSSNGMGDHLTATTGGDGTALIERVLAGNVQLTATAGVLRGSIAFTLLAGEVKPVTVALEPTASFAGVVYEPDGQTPAAGVSVHAGAVSVTTDANGNYRIDGLRLPPQYTLNVYDALGRRRAYTRTPLKFTGPGQVITRDFTMVGLGTVTGRVLNPDSSSAQDLSVAVTSFNPDFGGGRYGSTNAGGFYTIEDVPVGAFLVTTGNPVMQLLGEAAGTLDTHGTTVTVDIVLTSNAITPPVQRFDANNYRFDVQRNGATLTGSNAFRSAGGAVLDVVSAGVAQRFNGESIATVEDGGREIAVRELNLHGLNVTRKIAVPRAGYFARYLEILTNPTAQPITVDVRVSSNLQHTLLLNTSSGNSVIELTDAETADRWLVLDDAADGEGGTPATAFVFDGPGGADRVGAAAVSAASPRDLSFEWQNVTVPANSTVVYMHFIAQQTSRVAAATAAERLMGLGQEALDGLSLAEIGATRNFAMPADGLSLLAPLPRLDGRISGVAFEGDGTTPVANGTAVTFRSTEPLFGRSHTVSTNGAGAFALETALSDVGGTRVIPMVDFTLQARHPASNVLSPVTTGLFDEGVVTAIQNVVFSNTGLWQGVVRRHTNAAVTSGTVSIAGQTHAIAADASFFFRGLAAGSYNAVATIGHAQGTALTGNLAVEITAGQVTTSTLLIQPTGGARGRVLNADGSVVVAVQVRLQRSGFIRSLNTDTAGQFEFQDVPAGTYTVRSTDPATGLEVSQPVVIAQDLTATVADLAFAPKGTVQVESRLLRGGFVAGGAVYIREAARGNQLRHVGYTDGAGRFTITNVPVGVFTARVHHPVDGRFYGEASGEITADGDVIAVVVTMPGMGSVTGRVTNQDGSPAASVQVTVRSTHPTFGGFFHTQTDGNGVYRQDLLALGSVSATVFDTARQLFGEAFGALDTDGQTVTLDIQLTNNAIGLPAARFDVNNFYYDIATYAGIQSGTSSIFSAHDGLQYGAALLDVVRDGTRHRFTGSSIGTVEQAGREISVRQANLGGVDVVRKVFVPLEGFFARYLDTLNNPGTEPVTVALRISTNSYGPYYYSPQCGCYRYHPPSIVKTSSGDTSLNVSTPETADRWVVMEDNDPFKTTYGYATPSFALVFDGANADERVTSATYNIVDSYNGQVAYEWQNITIPPGGSVSYMHFVVQHSSMAAAQASAERLSLLPPEVLDGLNGEELTSIRNFDVPDDGLSSQPPLPALTGLVSGQVFASDGVTPLSFAQVTFRTNNLLFQRDVTTQADQLGNFLFRGVINEGQSQAVPAESYTLTARHRDTGATITVAGAFDGSFTGNVALAGTARASSSYSTAYLPSRVIDGNTTTSWYTEYLQSSSFGATPFIEVSLPSAAAVTHVNIRGNQSAGNDFLRGRLELFDGLDQVLHSQDFDLPAPSRTIEIDVPDQEGVRRVRFTGLADDTTHPGISELEIIGSIAAGAGIDEHDVSLTNTGTLKGRVLHSGGGAAASGIVEVYSGPVYTSSPIAADGSYVLTGLTPTSYTIRARVPPVQCCSENDASATVQIVAGQTTMLDFTLQPTGTVTGIVRHADNTPAVSTYVQVAGSRYYYTYTDANGVYTLSEVVAGDYELYVQEPNTGIPVTQPISVPANQTVTTNVTFFGLGSVNLLVQRANGSAAPNSLVYINRAGRGFQHAGSTDSAGRLLIPNVPAGAFIVRAHVPENTSFYVDVPGQVDTNGQVVPITAALPAVGSITGRITYLNGSPVTFSCVARLYNAAGTHIRTACTNNNGVYAFTSSLAVGEQVAMRAVHPNDTRVYRQTPLFALETDGETRVVDLTVPAFAALRVTVLKADGTPYAGARLHARDEFRTFFSNYGTTNGNGQLTLSSQPEGQVTIRVLDGNTGIALMDHVVTVVAANDGQTLDVLIQLNLFAGVIQGTVNTSDGLPVSGSFVEVLNATDLVRLASMTTGVTGAYSFSNLLAGSQGVIVRAHAPIDTSIIVDRTHTFTGVGQTAQIDLPLPIRRGRIDGQVVSTTGGVPLPSVTVQVFAAANPNFALGSRVTDQNGVFTFDGLYVRDGAFIVRAYSAVTVDQTGTFTASDVVVPLTIQIPVRPTQFTAKVMAADEATGIPSVYVELYSAEGSFLNWTYTDVNGVADFGTVLLPDNGVLRAYHQQYPDNHMVEVPFAVEPDGQMQVLATLPLSIVRGRVTFNDGTGVSNLSLFIRSPGELDGDGGGSPTRYAAWTDADGNYLVFGPPVGAMVVTAQDQSSGLSKVVDAMVTALHVPVTVDIALPPTGSVRARVLDADGTPRSNVQVVLLSENVAYDRYEYSGADGIVRFDYVPLGSAALQAADYSGPDARYASGGVTLVDAGATVAIDLRFAPMVMLQGTITNAAGTPLSSAQVHLESFASTGPLGYFNAWLTSDENGHYQREVPAGVVHVTPYRYDEAQSRYEHGYATTVVPAAGATLDVSLTEYEQFNVNLDGADGFRYDIRSDGAVSDGGRVDGSIEDAYDTAMELVIDDDEFCCSDWPRFELDRRQVVLGPSRTEPLIVTRKVFVPEAGGFARYLELLSNPSSVARSVRVRVQTDVGAGSTSRVVVAPLSTGHTYAVTNEDPEDGGGRPAIAHVFNGPGAPVAVTYSDFRDEEDDMYYEWRVVVPPGETIALMHFTAQRDTDPASGEAAAVAQAEALVSLSDPLALEGLTPLERSQIVNFAIPNQAASRGNIEGTIFAADGATPLPGALVQATDPLTGFVIAAATTEGTGHYAFNNLPAGPQGILLIAHLPFSTADVATRLVEFTSSNQTVSDANITLGVSVLVGRVLDAAGVHVPNASVIGSVVQTDGTPHTFSVTSDAEGGYRFFGVPSGAATVFAQSLATNARTTFSLSGGAFTIDDLQLADAMCIVPASSLAAWWTANGTTDSQTQPGVAGAAENGVSYADGKVGQAFSFDGVDDRVRFPDDPSQHSEHLSVATWVRFNAGTPELPFDREQVVLYKRNATPYFQWDGYSSAYMLWKNNDDTLRFTVTTENYGSFAVRTPFAVEPGRFYHVAATFDGYSLRLYVDGQLIDSLSGVPAPTPGTSPLVIGDIGETDYYQAPCNCLVDEPQLFSEALPPADIQALYVAAEAGTCDAFAVTSTELPDTFATAQFSHQLVTVGGVAPVTFALAANSTLPAGVTLSAAGSLDGIAGAGAFTFAVVATDGSGATTQGLVTKECLPCSLAPDGLVGLWQADRSARDSAGDNDGRESGAVSYVPGKFGHALKFTASHGFVEPRTPAFDVPADTFTMEFWARPEATRPVTPEQNFGITGTGGQRYAIGADYRGLSSYANAGVSVGTNGISVFEHGPSFLPSPLVYESPVALTEWTHIAVVYENRTPRLYVNGVLVRTGLTSPRGVSPSKAFGNEFGYGQYAGLLDDIGIYQRALADAEIQALAAGVAGKCPR